MFAYSVIESKRLPIFDCQTNLTQSQETRFYSRYRKPTSQYFNGPCLQPELAAALSEFRCETSLVQPEKGLLAGLGSDPEPNPTVPGRYSENGVYSDLYKLIDR